MLPFDLDCKFLKIYTNNCHLEIVKKFNHLDCNFLWEWLSHNKSYYCYWAYILSLPTIFSFDSCILEMIWKTFSGRLLINLKETWMDWILLIMALQLTQITLCTNPLIQKMTWTLFQHQCKLCLKKDIKMLHFAIQLIMYIEWINIELVTPLWNQDCQGWKESRHYGCHQIYHYFMLISNAIHIHIVPQRNIFMTIAILTITIATARMVLKLTKEPLLKNQQKFAQSQSPSSSQKLLFQLHAWKALIHNEILLIEKHSCKSKYTCTCTPRSSRLHCNETQSGGIFIFGVRHDGKVTFELLKDDTKWNVCCFIGFNGKNLNSGNYVVPMNYNNNIYRNDTNTNRKYSSKLILYEDNAPISESSLMIGVHNYYHDDHSTFENNIDISIHYSKEYVDELVTGTYKILCLGDNDNLYANIAASFINGCSGTNGIKISCLVNSVNESIITRQVMKQTCSNKQLSCALEFLWIFALFNSNQLSQQITYYGA